MAKFKVDTSPRGLATVAAATAQRADDAARQVEKDVLGLAPIAFTGHYDDLVGAPESSGGLTQPQILARGLGC